MLGTLALVALQAAFIYAPPFQALFTSAPLGGRDLGFSLAVAAAAVPLMALVKWASRGPGPTAGRDAPPHGLPTA